MDRVWQWAWGRYAARYSWVVFALVYLLVLPIYFLLSFIVVTFEGSDLYVDAAAVTAVAVLVLVYVTVLPGVGAGRVIQQWAAGREVDRARALDASYTYARGVVARALWCYAVGVALMLVVVGVIAGAAGSRLLQYAILGAAFGTSVQLIAVHSLTESVIRPARVAIASDTGIGDALPRSRPTFAAWSNMSILAAVFAFATAGALLASVFDRSGEFPMLSLAVACALTLGLGVPITVGASFSPSLQPIRDLAEGTDRVAAGDYSQRLPVVQDDDLGALAASFNRMQAGLAERQRLQAAFGTYVDPALAARLLEQGDDVFTGERRGGDGDVRRHPGLHPVRGGELCRGHRRAAQCPVRDRGACRRGRRWPRQQVPRRRSSGGLRRPERFGGSC